MTGKSEKNLFGESVKKKKRKSRLESSLEKYDKDTFEERLERLKFLNKIFPKEFGILADPETVYVFGEAKMAFVNGEFISTILLSQAFIERKLQLHYQSLGLDIIAKRGLKAIVTHAKKNNILHEYLIERIDVLRKRRNPFSHVKPTDHEFNLTQRMMTDLKSDKRYRQPFEIMTDDAKEAISLMYTIFITELKK
ncbi:hypothetical protein [Algibacter luteus]|uniref:hypothetical protein n=1 Tax=Algibacter luteus TaxID=1178825 RepID=UPI00259575AC|nr:hypothetical protein [Algibacter luteus]WJJ96582.1 hypothetical protein O5O44_15315 [Algibacter luteus]